MIDEFADNDPPEKRAESSLGRAFADAANQNHDPRASRMIEKTLLPYLKENSNENKKLKYDEAYSYQKLPYKEDSPPVKSSMQSPSSSAVRPLPDPLPIASGFYFDDEQLGWELFPQEFGEPQSIVCRAAFPRKDRKDFYDIISIEIPITKDADGLYIFDDSRLLQEHTNLANAHRRDALLFTAGFANSSVTNTKDYQQRDLPRLNERDPAFISLLKSIDKQIGDTPYSLSDIVSFYRIEDIIKHPLLAQDIPQSLQENQDIEVELDNGTTLTRIGRMPEPRNRDYLKHTAFKRQTLVRSVTIDEPQTLKAVSEVPAMLAVPAPDKYDPGLLKYLFNRKAFLEEKLYNAFIRELNQQGLALVSMEMMWKHPPMSGYMEFQDSEGRKFKFSTRMSDLMDGRTQEISCTEFRILDHEIGRTPTVRVEAAIRSDDYHKSKFRNEDKINLFAENIAVIVKKAWEAHQRLEKLDMPNIIESAKATWSEELQMPHTNLGSVTQGPLKDKATWEDIDRQLRCINHEQIYGLPHNLDQLLKHNGIGTHEHDAKMGRHNKSQLPGGLEITI